MAVMWYVAQGIIHREHRTSGLPTEVAEVLKGQSQRAKELVKMATEAEDYAASARDAKKALSDERERSKLFAASLSAIQQKLQASKNSGYVDIESVADEILRNYI